MPRISLQGERDAAAADPVDVPGDTAGAVPAQPDHGRGVHTTWLYTLGSIVFAVLALSMLMLAMAGQLYMHTMSALDGALCLAMIASAAIQVRYCWFLRRGRGGGLPSAAWNVALLLPPLTAWVIGLFEPELGAVSAVPLWMALCLASALLSTKQRRMVLVGGVLAIVAHPMLSAAIVGEAPESFTGSSFWLLVFYCGLFPVMVLSSMWWWEVVVKLDQHRRTAADLAVTQERLRFAADLHDIQGHHLQVIALKSELAERLLDRDIEAARANIHETRLIAKQALEETRLLVSGYREIALGEEIENAREVLAASGAECALEVDPSVLTLGADAAGGGLSSGSAGTDADAGAGAEAGGDVGADARRALALAVREATTNILRHSSATQASIQLRLTDAGCVLTVRNNGVVAGAAPSRVPGSGLRGLRERVVALGGEVESINDPAEGSFELRVRVPLQQEVAA